MVYFKQKGGSIYKIILFYNKEIGKISEDFVVKIILK